MGPALVGHARPVLERGVVFVLLHGSRLLLGCISGLQQVASTLVMGLEGLVAADQMSVRVGWTFGNVLGFSLFVIEAFVVRM